MYRIFVKHSPLLAVATCTISVDTPPLISGSHVRIDLRENSVIRRRWVEVGEVYFGFSLSSLNRKAVLNNEQCVFAQYGCYNNTVPPTNQIYSNIRLFQCANIWTAILWFVSALMYVHMYVFSPKWSCRCLCWWWGCGASPHDPVAVRRCSLSARRQKGCCHRF